MEAGGGWGVVLGGGCCGGEVGGVALRGLGENRKETKEQSKSVAEPGEERRPPTDHFSSGQKKKVRTRNKSASPSYVSEAVTRTQRHAGN